MIGFLSQLFDTSDFPARWHCGSWTAGHGWLHILSDLGIWGAYVTIPLIIGFFVLRRKDVPFTPIFGLFGLFIFACGTTHLMESIIFWWPAYRLAGVIKVVTAMASWATVVALVPIVPKALRLPRLARMNQELELENRERRRTEQALQEVNDALARKNAELEQFLHMVSHDLKSPIVTIRGFIGVLKEDLAEKDYQKVQESAERIERASLRVRSLIDDLLQFSRVGSAHHEHELVDMSQLVQAVASGLEHPLQAAGARLEIDPDLPHLMVDRAAVVQVFDNLLNNALKYGCGGENRLIRVGAVVPAQSDEVHLFVRDHGQGIAQQYHQKIFKLFQRLGTEPEGTGVGLAIVAKVMHHHAGRVWVESAPGEGATFWLAFPRRPGAAIGQLNPNGESDAAANGSFSAGRR